MMTMRIIPVIRLALKLDAVARSIKRSRMIAVTLVIVMHTMRASYRVAYHPAEEITLHAIQRQMDSKLAIFIIYSNQIYG